MKSFIFACALLLAPGPAAFGQETAPADTGAVQIPSQPGTATDTGTTSIPPSEQSPSDTAAIPPPGGTDTGTVAVPPATPDTGAVAAPSDTSRPADTTAIPPPAPPPQPREAEPAPVTPQPETAPAETPSAEEEISGTPKPPNRFALGLVFNDEAPVAMRAWFNPKVGLDVGLGINLRQVEDQSLLVPHPESTTTFMDLSFDLGIPVRALRKDKVDFIIRPGFGFRTRPGFFADENDPSVRSVETSLELEINGTVGFEYYPFEKASFGLFAGIALIADRPGGTGNTIVRVESLPSKKGVNFAFRYYLF